MPKTWLFVRGGGWASAEIVCSYQSSSLQSAGKIIRVIAACEGAVQVDRAVNGPGALLLHWSSNGGLSFFRRVVVVVVVVQAERWMFGGFCSPVGRLVWATDNDTDCTVLSWHRLNTVLCYHDTDHAGDTTMIATVVDTTKRAAGQWINTHTRTYSYLYVMSSCRLYSQLRRPNAKALSLPRSLRSAAWWWHAPSEPLTTAWIIRLL